MLPYVEALEVVGPFQCNCRILACPETGDALVIDPGDEPKKILDRLKQLRTPSGAPVKPKWLLHTHGHLDHVGASRGVKTELVAQGQNPELMLHRGDDELYKALIAQGKLFGITYEEPLPIDRWLEDGERMALGKLRFTLLHTPGHSPGSISLRLHEDSGMGVPETLFTGDTLFKGSVGRTDLWGADQDQMFKSIRDRLLTLDDETRVCPGHGPTSKIGLERRENPFLRSL